MVTDFAWYFEGILLFASWALALYFVNHMVRERRPAQSITAWLMFMFFLPVLGVIAYIFFGWRKVHKRRHRSKSPIDFDSLHSPVPEPANAHDSLIRTYGVPAAFPGNRVELLSDCAASYASLIEMIDSAEKQVWIDIYLFAPDKIGKLVVDRLAEAAKRGVEVKLLLDDVGSMGTNDAFLAPVTEAGGEISYFLPVRRSFALRNLANLRNHRKVVIADQSRVWSGGTNIGELYISPEPEEGSFCDLSFLLEGPASAAYGGIFRSDWFFSTGKRIPLMTAGEIEKRGDALVQPMPSGPDVVGDGLFEVIGAMIYSARKRLWITSPYFIPGETLGCALSLAARRGVDLRIMVPKRSDHRICDLARGPYLRDLDNSGARIFRYAPSMLHAKAMVIDDSVGMIGSCNFDQRSFFLNFELASFFYSEPEIEALAAWFEETFADCEEGPRPVSYFEETLQGVARVFSPLL
ncbi:MAG: phospholipase D-like domain-containing protein [Rhodovibrionaceae bacterium]